MIVVDTSALIALFLKEVQWADLASVLRNEDCVFPAPVLLEFATVAGGRYNQTRKRIDDFLAALTANKNIRVTPFGGDDALFARIAADVYGKGRGNRAQLNVVDLMVYGIAKRSDAPILCTGRDFAQTDIAIHPSSRLT